MSWCIMLFIGGWPRAMTQRAIDGDFIYFVTTNVHHGRWFFDVPERAALLGQAIQTCCRMKHFDLLTYCILPNHVHLLVRKLTVDEINDVSTAFGAHRTRGRLRCAGGEAASCMRRVGGKEGPASGMLEESSAFFFPDRRRPRLRSPEERFTLSQLMHSIKSTFAHDLARGRFWHRRSYFRIIESEEYFANVIEYIRYNYRKMNLPERYGRPPFVFIDQSAIERIFKK